MRALLVLAAVVQAAVVAVWGCQLLADRHRPPDRQWVPRRWPLFICLQGVVVVADVVAAFGLSD